jgi:hypothetical protein
VLVAGLERPLVCSVLCFCREKLINQLGGSGCGRKGLSSCEELKATRG